MAETLGCRGSQCCLHQSAYSAARRKDSNSKDGHLMTISLLSEELKPLAGLADLPTNDIQKQIDLLTDKLRLASFISKTLTDRVNELRAVVETHQKPPSNTPHSPIQPPQQQSAAQKPLLRSTFQQSHLQQSPTPPATPSTTEVPDWTQRCAAYYQKRLAQQEATSARLAKNDAMKGSQQSSPSLPNALPTPPHSGGPSAARNKPTASTFPKPLFDQSKKEELLVSKWRAYELQWDMITKAMNTNARPFLTMTTVPWPILRTEHDSEEVDEADITSEDIDHFLLSHLHSINKPRDVRVRDAYLRWHPDKANRWLAFVVPSERQRVKMMVDRVAFALNNLK